MIATMPKYRSDPAITFPPPSSRHLSSLRNNILLVDHNKQELDALSACLNDTYELFVARNESDVLNTIETQSTRMVGFHFPTNCGKIFFNQFRVRPTVYQKLKKR